MNQHIHCLVNDCHYWGQGNKCQANEILVSPDSFAENQPAEIDATMANQLNSAAAGSSMATACKTYVTKGSDEVNQDRIRKMS